MKGTKRWQARGRDKIGDERENLYSCLVERGYILCDSLRVKSRSSHSLKEKLVFVRRGIVKTPEARLYRVRNRLVLWSLPALCAQEAYTLQKLSMHLLPPCSSGSEALQGLKT